MEQIFTKEFIYKGYEDKGTVSLYKLISLSMAEEDFSAIGNKIDGLEIGQKVVAEIRIRTNSRLLYNENKEKGTYDKVWVNDTKFFINSLIPSVKDGDGDGIATK